MRGCEPKFVAGPMTAKVKFRDTLTAAPVASDSVVHTNPPVGLAPAERATGRLLAKTTTFLASVGLIPAGPTAARTSNRHPAGTGPPEMCTDARPLAPYTLMFWIL